MSVVPRSLLGLSLCFIVLGGCDDASKSTAHRTVTTGAHGAPVVDRPREINPLPIAGPQAFQLVLSATTEVPSQKSKNTLEITGKLWLSSRSEGKAVRLVAVLDHPQLLVNGAPEETLGAAVTRMAEGATFLFSRGQIEEGAFPLGIRPEVANFWRTIMAPLQFHPSPTTVGISTATEFDSTGEYEAAYTFDGDNLVRKKLKYNKVLQSGPKLASIQQMEPKLEQSEARLNMPGGHLAALSLTEAIRADLQPGVTLHVLTKLTLQSAPVDSNSAQAQLRLTELFSSAQLLTIPSHQAIALKAMTDDAQFDELKMKDWSFDAALAAVADEKAHPSPEETRSDASRQRVYSAYSTLAAYLRSKPETLALAERKIWAGEAALPVVGALKMAGTPAAQQLLIKVIKTKSLPLELRSYTIIELTNVREPMVGLAEQLRPVLTEPKLREQTLLGLGVLGRFSRDEGRQAEFDVVSEIIAHEFKGAGQSERLTQALAGMSNLGDARHFELVQPYLSSSDETVRRAALVALRHMKSQQVDPVLAKALGEEQQRNTLLALISALRLRGPLPIHRQALAALLIRKDLDGQVASRAAALQASWNETARVN